MDGSKQDIEFIIEEKPHSTFKRDGDQLRMELTVDLVEALCGFSKQVTHLDGHIVTVAGAMGRDVVADGKEIRIPNEGMPISKSPGKKGDLVVKVHVRFPTSLNPDQKEALRRILV